MTLWYNTVLHKQQSLHKNTDILWTNKERTDNGIVETKCFKSSQFSQCHKNVTKQTNPLVVHNLITNKYVAILEASRRILNTVHQNLFLYTWKVFKKHYNVVLILHQAAREQDMLQSWTASSVH